MTKLKPKNTVQVLRHSHQTRNGAMRTRIRINNKKMLSKVTKTKPKKSKKA
jgi:dihydropteroate synthase